MGVRHDPASMLEHRGRGYVYMVTSTTSFAIVAATSKAIGARATTFEKLFWRSILCLFFTLLGSSHGPKPTSDAGPSAKPEASPSWRPRYPALLLLRGLCGHVALCAFMEAIDRIPLAEAVFIGKLHPVSAAVIAWAFLGEPLRFTRLMAIVASLAGLALIATPSAESLANADHFGTFLATVAGVLSGAAYVCVRALARAGEADMWMLVSFPLVSIPFCVRDAWAGLDHLVDDYKLPTLLLLQALSAQAGQVFLAKGLRLLSAAAGTQVMYFGAIVSAGLGLLLGDGWPSLRVWAGGAIIMGSLHFADVAERWDEQAARKKHRD